MPRKTRRTYKNRGPSNVQRPPSFRKSFAVATLADVLSSANVHDTDEEVSDQVVSSPWAHMRLLAQLGAILRSENIKLPAPVDFLVEGIRLNPNLHAKVHFDEELRALALLCRACSLDYSDATALALKMTHSVFLGVYRTATPLQCQAVAMKMVLQLDEDLKTVREGVTTWTPVEAAAFAHSTGIQLWESMRDRLVKWWMSNQVAPGQTPASVASEPAPESETDWSKIIEAAGKIGMVALDLAPLAVKTKSPLVNAAMVAGGIVAAVKDGAEAAQAVGEAVAPAVDDATQKRFNASRAAAAQAAGK